MLYDAEDTINKCVEGRAPRDVLRLIEEELPDVGHVRKDLLNDFNRIGLRINNSDIIVESTCIKVTVSPLLMEKKGNEIMTIADTYSRIYSEIDVLLATKS